MKAADVDVVLAQDCADVTDDAGHVVIARDEHVAVWNRLDAKAVDLCDASIAAACDAAEECARDRLLAARRQDARADGGSKIAARALVRSSDADSPFLCDEEGVDDVDTRAHIAQQAREESPRDRRSIKLDHLASILKPYLAHSLVNQLRLKSAETFSKRDIRLKRIQHLSAERRHIHLATQRA